MPAPTRAARAAIAAREELVLDLTVGTIQIGDWFAAFESPAADEILDVYLDLVRDMRGSEHALARGLRSDDLAALGAALVHDPSRLETRLERLVARRRSLRARLLPLVAPAVALAGIVVAVGVATMVWRAAVVTAGAPNELQLARSGTVDAPAPIVSESVTDELGGEALVVVPIGSADPTARVERVEALIDWDFRTALAGWTIVYAEPHPSWRGLTNSIQRTVTLYDRPEASPAEAAEVLAHELGHVVDLDHLDDTQRNAWRELRGITAPWWAEDGLADFSVGSGDFAEAVAAVLVGSPSQSDFGRFTDGQLAFVAAILDELG